MRKYIAVNNDENDAVVRFNTDSGKLFKAFSAFRGKALKGDPKNEEDFIVSAGNNYYEITLPPCSGMILKCMN